ncbi:hypothetical protein SLEP1_g15800 [Rubroshorea leprosula]|uniref:Uncharacterized protein n=1 Tax=Rubroshorea leprosula TaxID=152421 RepID=A0AAV5IY00_9ROSI|nr:hypothetical protein SLEP1_g15800 [Rubroshorea leprosula]
MDAGMQDAGVGIVTWGCDYDTYASKGIGARWNAQEAVGLASGGVDTGAVECTHGQLGSRRWHGGVQSGSRHWRAWERPKASTKRAMLAAEEVSTCQMLGKADLVSIEGVSSESSAARGLVRKVDELQGRRSVRRIPKFHCSPNLHPKWPRLFIPLYIPSLISSTFSHGNMSVWGGAAKGELTIANGLSPLPTAMAQTTYLVLGEDIVPSQLLYVPASFSLQLKRGNSDSGTLTSRRLLNTL